MNPGCLAMETQTITLQPRGMTYAAHRPKIEWMLKEASDVQDGWVELHPLSRARCVAGTHGSDKTTSSSACALDGADVPGLTTIRRGRCSGHSTLPLAGQSCGLAHCATQMGGTPRFLSEIVGDKPAGTGVGSNAPAEAGRPPA